MMTIITNRPMQLRLGTLLQQKGIGLEHSMQGIDQMWFRGPVPSDAANSFKNDYNRKFFRSSLLSDKSSFCNGVNGNPLSPDYESPSSWI